MDSVINLGLFKDGKVFTYLPKDSRYFVLPQFNGKGLNFLENRSDNNNLNFNKVFDFLQDHIHNPPSTLSFYGSLINEGKFHEVYKATLENESVLELDGIERTLWVPLKDYDEYSLSQFHKKKVFPFFYNKDVVVPSLNGKNTMDKKYVGVPHLKNL